MNIKRAISHPIPYLKVAFNRSQNFFRALVYKGNKVHCEICDWHGKRFFNEKCPNCNSLPRTRLIPYAMTYFKVIQDQSTILHIAPNLNEFNFIRKQYPHVGSYDRLNIRSVPHINIVQDLTTTNLDSELYDLAIAWHVLEHIPQDKKAISEVYRLLKPGGFFLVSVPIFPLESSTTFESDDISYDDYEKIHGHYDHCRSCGLDYYKRFEALGFSTKTLMIKDLDESDKHKFGLFEHHVVWCFKK